MAAPGVSEMTDGIASIISVETVETSEHGEERSPRLMAILEEIHDLCAQLPDVGVEAMFVTANLSSGSYGHFGTAKGLSYLSSNLDVGLKFFSFCTKDSLIIQEKEAVAVKHQEKTEHAEPEQLMKPRHKCTHCAKSFFKPSDLLRHERTHTGEKPFYCHVCSKAFAVTSTLKKHMKTHKSGTNVSKKSTENQITNPGIADSQDVDDESDQGTVTSDLSSTRRPDVSCQTDTNTTDIDISEETSETISSTLEETNVPEQPFSVLYSREEAATETSGDLSQSFGDLSKTINERLNQKVLKDKTVYIYVKENMEVEKIVVGKEAEGEEKEKLKHTDKGPTVENLPETRQRVSKRKADIDHNYDCKSNLRCNDCGQTFSNLSNLTNHSSYIHPKRFSCQYCNKTFSKRERLKNHIDNVHKEERPFQCDLCEKTYKTRINLRYHQRNTHKKGLTEHVFPCNICTASFTHPKSLARHKKNAHTNPSGDPQRYRCNFCFKYCGRKDTLKNHMRLHSEEKPHNCLRCDETFQTRKQLTTHLQRNHPEDTVKHHKCPDCNMEFHTKKQLATHQQKQHPDVRIVTIAVHPV